MDEFLRSASRVWNLWVWPNCNLGPPTPDRNDWQLVTKSGIVYVYRDFESGMRAAERYEALHAA